MQPVRLSKAIFAATFTLILGIGTLPLAGIASDRVNTARQGLPGRRISGGVREGNCFTDFNQSLVAMMPRNNLGKTSAARPSFWFSMPETSGYSEVQFQLIDESNEIIYSTQINPSSRYGLSEFKLPESAPELLANQNYQWVFSVGCSDVSRFEVQGWVRRVNLPALEASQIEAATAEERLALYESEGLWHEQVSELVNLRRSNLTNIDFQIKWAALVESTGLASDISSAIADPMSAIE
jgi:Domain of Unknown Function (DUF928)